MLHRHEARPGQLVLFSISGEGRGGYAPPAFRVGLDLPPYAIYLNQILVPSRPRSCFRSSFAVMSYHYQKNQPQGYDDEYMVSRSRELSRGKDRRVGERERKAKRSAANKARRKVARGNTLVVECLSSILESS